MAMQVNGQITSNFLTNMMEIMVEIVIMVMVVRVVMLVMVNMVVMVAIVVRTGRDRTDIQT